jgi:hypothetical protein
VQVLAGSAEATWVSPSQWLIESPSNWRSGVQKVRDRIRLISGDMRAMPAVLENRNWRLTSLYWYAEPCWKTHFQKSLETKRVLPDNF